MLIPANILKILEQERARLSRNQSGSDEEDEVAMDTLQATLMAPLLAKEAAKEARRQQAVEKAAAVAKTRELRAAFFARVAELGLPLVAADNGISARLGVTRRELRLSQSIVANAVGVTPALVSQWENGHRPIPPQHLERLAALFQKPVSYFTGNNLPLELPRGYALNAEGVICKHMMKALPNGGTQKEYVPLTDEEKTELRRQGVVSWAQKLLV